ncbi:MAG: hypothetical protein LBB55_02560, partial [Zoogloeaceae bacterium]|nr:hypothetical protein [Zoogloeaceae bacterium]
SFITGAKRRCSLIALICDAAHRGDECRITLRLSNLQNRRHTLADSAARCSCVIKSFISKPLEQFHGD